MTWPAGQAEPQAPAARTVWCWRIHAGDLAPHHVASLVPLLSADESARADRFRLPDDRQNYIAAHAGLRLLLAAALRRRPAELAFVLNAHGKPMLGDGALDFSLSHSGNMVLIAISRGQPVGVDVERWRTVADRAAIARDFFHAGEIADLASLSGRAAEHAFFRCWTRKEAVAKATGLGLSLPLDQYRVSCRPGEPVQMLAFNAAGPRADEWSLVDLEPGAGYAAALAVPARAIDVACRTLDLGIRTAV